MTDGEEETAPGVWYRLTLFVAGASGRSLRAVANLHEFCERELAGCYELEVVDLYRWPERARQAQVVAAPTLLRHEPEPRRCVIGDLSEFERLRRAVVVAS